MRAAKARAAEQGISLKEFLARAVSAELGRRALTFGKGLPRGGQPGPSAYGCRSSLRSGTGTVRLTNADLADLEAADDLEKHRRTLR